MTEQSSRERPPRILVVDDNETNRALAQSTLEDEGFVVELAPGGRDAIARIEAKAPDCVVLDVRMPDMDGFAVCERIRSMPGGKSIPVVFLTALRDVDTFDRALRAGGDDFLTKPVRPTELVVRVQTALEMRRLRTELSGHYDLLKRQRDDMMRLQLQKERLMAFVVHDLKNPVNSMDLHAQVLLRDKTLPASARDSVLQIRSEARQLHRMILNLLDLSRADEGKLEPRRTVVDLEVTLAAIVSELEVSAANHGCALEVELDAKQVGGDEDLLRRTLTNLVENAIRHSPAKSVVRISSRETGGAVELRVSDRGPGVPAEMRERIFDAFVQMESDGRPRSTSGRGLGLTFCKLAVEAHGGTIWVEDGAPGAVMCVRLPR